MKTGVLVVLGSIWLSGCFQYQTQTAGGSGGIPIRSKVVFEKVEPNILVAHDRSTCETTKQRWEKAKVGRSILCAWSGR